MIGVWFKEENKISLLNKKPIEELTIDEKLALMRKPYS